MKVRLRRDFLRYVTSIDRGYPRGGKEEFHLEQSPSADLGQKSSSPVIPSLSTPSVDLINAHITHLFSLSIFPSLIDLFECVLPRTPTTRILRII